MEKGRIIGIIIGLGLSVLCYLQLFIRFLTQGRKIFHVKSRTVEPACLQDPKYGAHNYAKINGVKIHYVEAGSRDSGKPLMVFVHGFPEFWFVWRHQIEYFKEAGYRVVAPDLRGYGDSEKLTDLNQYCVKDLADDIKSLVEHLGETKFTLVAHDWGGLISWTFAALYPEMLDNLIICNCPHLVAVRAAGLEQKLKSWYFFFFQVPWLPELFAMSQDMVILESMLKDGNIDAESEVMEAYKYTFRNCRQWTSAINLYRGSFTNKTKEFWADPAIKQKIRNIKVRTLQIFGTEDKYISEVGAVNSKKYVSDHTLELLNGVSHWVQQEEPDKVNKLMHDFLSKK